VTKGFARKTLESIATDGGPHELLGNDQGKTRRSQTVSGAIQRQPTAVMKSPTVFEDAGDFRRA